MARRMKKGVCAVVECKKKAAHVELCRSHYVKARRLGIAPTRKDGNAVYSKDQLEMLARDLRVQPAKKPVERMATSRVSKSNELLIAVRDLTAAIRERFPASTPKVVANGVDVETGLTTDELNGATA